MKKLMLFLIFLFLLMPIAYSKNSVFTQFQEGLEISTNIPEAISQNITREFEVHAYNNSKFLENITCHLHIYDEMGTGGPIYRNTTSISEFQGYEFIVPASVHSDKGLYSFKAYCNSTDQTGFYELNYFVTKSGETPAEGLFLIFIYLLFIISTVGLFIAMFLTIAKIATHEETIFGVLYSWSLILLNLMVIYLAENYLLTTFVENLATTFFKISIFSNGILPLIGFIISYIFRSLKKKKPLTYVEVLGRGRF